MRNRLTAGLLALISILLFPLLAFQRPGSPQKQAMPNTNPYEAEWKTIDSLEDQGLPRSALEQVQALYERAQREGQSAEWIKTIIYINKYQSELEEDGLVKAIARIQSEADRASFPEQALLQSMLGELYKRYFEVQRWKLRNRTETGGERPEDIALWTSGQLLEEAARQYLLSVKDERSFQQPISEWQAILEAGDSSAAQLRPTLYDFLAHRAIDHFTSDQSGLTEPAYRYVLRDSVAFAPAQAFAQADFSGQDSSSYTLRVLHLLQQLTQLRLEGAQTGPMADLDLKRLKFVYEKAVIANKGELYESALDRMAESYAESPEVTQVWYALASHYQRLGNEYEALGDTTHRWKLREALEWCDKAIEAYPKSYGAQQCKALRTVLLSSDLSLQTEAVNLPEKPILLSLAYRNIEQIHLRLIPLSAEAHFEFNNRSGSEALETLKTLKAVKEWSEVLPDEGDYQSHRLELSLEGKPFGHYALLYAKEEDFDTDASLTSVLYFSVSELGVLYQQTKGQFLIAQRETGQPLPGVKGTFFKTEYNRRENKQDLVKQAEATSDKDGMMPLPTKGSRDYLVPQFSRGEDVLLLNSGFSNNYEKGSPSRMETAFFLDRAIYRPGQAIYFKALVLQKDKDGVPKILPNQRFTVTFLDANRQEVEQLQLRTNAYGTANGVFTAPSGGLLGQMRLISDTGNGMHYFSVEEYKRPKFEVKLEPLEGQPELGDTVRMSGMAKGYAGNAIDGAELRYRVVRGIRFPWWPWWRPMPGYGSSEMEIANGVLQTGTDGGFDIPFLAQADESVPAEQRPEFTFTVYVDVTDAAGETRSANRSLRLAYIKLKASLDAPGEADLADGLMKIDIAAQNLDGQPIPAQGQLRIHRLQPPNRAMVERYWPRPDYYRMSEAEFAQQFPYLPYGDEDQKQNWPTSALQSEQDISTDGQDTLFLNYSDWPVGHYRARLVLEDEDGQEVESEKYITVYDSKKQRWPAGDFTWARLKDEGPFEPGDQAQMQLGSPAAKLAVLAEVERKGEILEQQWLKASPWQTFNYTVKEADKGDVYLHFNSLHHNRLFQWQQRLSVPWKDKALTITFGTFRDKLQPGQEEVWQLKISGHNQETVAAEVLASMYDASLDAFRPHGWSFSPFPSNYSQASWSGQSFSAASGRQFRYYSPFYNMPNNAGRSYYQLNWFDWYAYGGIQPMANQRMLGLTARSEAAPAEYASAQMDEATAVEEMDSSKRKGEGEASVSGPEGDPDVAPPVRRNLKETVFFYPELRTDEAGNILIRFKMNEALTRWKFQALAHTPELQYALAERELITQKELMVQPNPPRFLREGDVIEFSAKVSNLSEGELEGQARLQLFDALSMQPVDELLGNEQAVQPFRTAAGQSAGLSWKLRVPKGKVMAIVHRVTVEAGSFTDGEEAALPVLTNRLLLTETLPMPVKGEEKKTFRFAAMDKADESATLAHHGFTLEFTSNPAWYAVKALPYIMEGSNASVTSLFNRYYANSLAGSIVKGKPELERVFEQWRDADDGQALLSELEQNEELKNIILEQTPWVRDAQSETAQRQRIGLLFDLNRMSYEQEDALRKLKERQLPSGGFAWFPGGRASWHTTQSLLEGMGRLRELSVAELSVNGPTWPMVTKATEFVDGEMEQHYRDWGKKDSDNLPSIAVHYLYTRSLFPELEVTGEAKQAFDDYLKRAQAQWLKRNLYEQAMLAVVFQKQQLPQDAQRIMASLRERALYDEEQGMYWKYNTGYYWYQLPIETHAMLIEAFATVAEDEEAVELLKVWLLKNKQTNNWKTGKATASAVYALLKYGNNWLSETKAVQVSFQGLEVESYRPQLAAAQQQAEAGTGYIKASWPAEAVSTAFADIQVDNPNASIAWGAAYWQYFEDLDQVKVFKDTPLKLDKQLFREEASDRGPTLNPITEASPLKPGDKLVVRINLRVDRDMEYVHLQDLRASGLEPVNVLSSYKWQGGLGYYESTKDASTDFFFDRLPKGTYVFEYALRAVHRGDFSNGLARIQCLYAPEYSSHAEGVRVVVE